eukprot:g17205.t1
MGIMPAKTWKSPLTEVDANVLAAIVLLTFVLHSRSAALQIHQPSALLAMLILLAVRQAARPIVLSAATPAAALPETRISSPFTDCVWRAKNGGDGEWRDVKKRELLSLSEDHISSFDVTEPHKLKKGPTGQPWTISYMSLKMNKGHGDGLVARLYTQCIPGDHLDYKVIMFDKKDIDIVGGELGVTADSTQKEINPITGQSHLLSSRLRSMHMRADSEFQVEKSWADLGGTKAGSSYLEQEPEPSLAPGIFRF